MSLRPASRLSSLAVILLLAGSARAAGGAHVVDDSEVETPGVCHAEAWAVRGDDRAGLVNLSPGCTPKALPRLELGGAIQRLWGGAPDTTVGPAFKLNLRRADRGLGLALGASGAWSLRSGRLETAGLVAPLTARLGGRLTLNLNGGWSYARASAHRNAAMLGAQAEIQATRSMSLMIEAFGRGYGRAGLQAGVRWTPADGPLDIDLLAGRRVDGVMPFAATLGVTLRR